jgi:hypothetical protein
MFLLWHVQGDIVLNVSHYSCHITPHTRQRLPPHSLCLDVAGWLAFSNDFKNYTSGSIVTGRVFLASQVEAEEPE